MWVKKVKHSSEESVVNLLVSEAQSLQLQHILHKTTESMAK